VDLREVLARVETKIIDFHSKGSIVGQKSKNNITEKSHEEIWQGM
jgi:hypothetical protein